MNRKSSISAQLGADKSQWTSTIEKAGAEGRKFVGDMNSLKSNPGFFKSMQGKWTEFNSKMEAGKNTVETVIAAVEKPAAANAWYGDLADGLAAVMEDADAAKEHLGQLRLISDDMSISDEGFSKMVDYSERIQSLGYSAEFAAKFIREAANAAEYMGKGIEDMDGLIGGLDKIGNKGEASLKSIIALTEAVPAFRTVMKGAFGTSNAKELEEMNLSAKQLTEGILRGMQKLETAKPGTVEEGLAVKERKMQLMGADSEDNNGELPDREPTSPYQATQDRAAFLDDLAKEKEAKEAEAAAELEQKVQILEMEESIKRSKAAGHDEEAAALEDKLSLMTRAKDLVKEMGVSQEVANAAVIRENEARRQTEQWLKNKEKYDKQDEGKKSLHDAAENLAITEARGRGNEKQAKKLEREQQRRQQEQSLIAAGVDPRQAAVVSERNAKAEEDMEYLQRTGRKRIKGAVSRRKSGGDWLHGGTGYGGGFLNPSTLDGEDQSAATGINRNSQKAAHGAAPPSAATDQILSEILNTLRNDKRSVADKTRPRS